MRIYTSQGTVDYRIAEVDSITFLQSEVNSQLQEFVDHVEVHFQDGPFITVAPSIEKEGAPTINEEHTCYALNSVSNEGWLHYTVKLNSGETETDRTLFLESPEIMVSLLSSDGTEIHGHAFDLDEVTVSHIQSGFVFHDLQAETYTIKLEGLTNATTTKIMMTHPPKNHEHDH